MSINSINKQKQSGQEVWKGEKTFCKLSRWKSGLTALSLTVDRGGSLVVWSLCKCWGKTEVERVAPNNAGDSWDTVVHGQVSTGIWLL